MSRGLNVTVRIGSLHRRPGVSPTHRNFGKRVGTSRVHTIVTPVPSLKHWQPSRTEIVPCKY
eukprot:477399-Hanusia_phi.AAC.3